MAEPNNVRIVGGGLAGCAAALAALSQGARPTIFDPSKNARHRVCGEFLSPEVRQSLEGLGVWEAAASCAPALMYRMQVHFGNRICADRLPEPAIGLSRLRLDHLMRQAAVQEGCLYEPDRASPSAGCVLATGRQAAPPSGDRIFGFKAHFSGPPGDAVELYFGDRFYVGVNPVEAGITNVCGLAPESLLRELNFNYDALLGRSPALADRTKPLTRTMEWLTTGPLNYGRTKHPIDLYAAGDAFSFIDPFTGAGMLNALVSGRMAGAAVARQEGPAAYRAALNKRLGRPLFMATVFRKALGVGVGQILAPWIPGRWLFSLTRPS